MIKNENDKSLINLFPPTGNNYKSLSKTEKYISEIFEKYGAFSEQYKIATKILKDIKTFLSDNIEDILYKQKLIFKKKYSSFVFIHIDMEISNIESEIYKTDYIDFHTYKITIKTPIYKINNNYSARLYEIINHELLHIYQDYNLRKNSNKTIFGSKLSYNKIIKVLNDNYYPKYIRDFCRNLYLLTDFEINANVSMIYSELVNINAKLEDVNKILRRLEIYNEYTNIEKVNNKILQNSSEDEIQEIINIYDIIFGTSYHKDYNHKRTLSDICDNMNARAFKVIKKMIRNAKLYYDDLINDKIEKYE